MVNKRSIARNMKSNANRFHLFMEMVNQIKLAELHENEFEISNVIYQNEVIVDGKKKEVLGLVFKDKSTAIKMMNLIIDLSGTSEAVGYEKVSGNHLLVFYFKQLKLQRHQCKILENTESTLTIQNQFIIGKYMYIKIIETNENVLNSSSNGIQKSNLKFIYAKVWATQ